jgi:hypothetical protein
MIEKDHNAIRKLFKKKRDVGKNDQNYLFIPLHFLRQRMKKYYKSSVLAEQDLHRGKSKQLPSFEKTE